MFKIGILTVSDRSYQGLREDLSGPALSKLVEEKGWSVAFTQIVPDDIQLIQNTLLDWCDLKKLDLILTTGGTGFTPRDVTPEATQPIIDKLAPGLAEAMRQESVKVTPHAMLSRAIAGIRKTSLIINLPGSPKAAVENLCVIMPVLPHAIELLHNNPSSEGNHKFISG